MNIIIIILIIILGVLIYLYYKNENMYEHLELYPNGVNFTIDLAVVQAGVPASVPASLPANVPASLPASVHVVSDPTIWTVGETLKIGDIKSSPNGNFKYTFTNRGLEYYNINSNKVSIVQHQPMPLINKDKSSILLTTSGTSIDNKSNNYFFCNTSSFKGTDNTKYIMSPFNVNNSLDMYKFDGTHIGNPDTKIYNDLNTLSSGGFTINMSGNNFDPRLSYLKFTDKGIYGIDKTNKFICVI